MRWNTVDTILIDFSHSGIEDCLSRDASKLDTSIALTAKDKNGKLLGSTVLSKLYRRPLLPLRDLTSTDGRIEAIREIRRQAGGEGIHDLEYGILTVCHLLKFASEPDHEAAAKDKDALRSRRALSYSLACKLVDQLAN